MPASIKFEKALKVELSSVKEGSYVVIAEELYYYKGLYKGQVEGNQGNLVSLMPFRMCEQMLQSCDLLCKVVDVEIIVKG